jgi:hypothetical protein
MIRNVIRKACEHLRLWSPVAEELLMLTWAHESEGGKYRKQVGGGPALGVFQMEPATFNDIVKNYLKYRPEVYELVKQLGPLNSQELVNNDLLAAAMARLQYRRAKEKLPSATDPVLLAGYWDRHYQSDGKVDLDKQGDAIADYRKYVTDANA